MFVTSRIQVLVLILAVSALPVLAVAQSGAPASTAPGGAAPSPATAPAPANAPPAVKIGIVNIQDAIVSTNEGQKEFDGLQTRFTPKQTELKAMNDEVEKLKTTYEAQKDKLSPDASASQVRLIESKQKTLQRNYDDAQSEFQQAEQEVVNRIGSKMLGVMEKYAQAHGFAVILDVSNPQTPVLYANKGIDLTKQLVEAYNVESGVPPPAKPVAAPSTAPRPAAPAPTPKKP